MSEPAVIQVPLSRSGLVAIVDAADFERELFCEFSDGFMWMGKLSSRCWKPLAKNHTTYAITTLLGGRELRMHRAVFGARAGQIIDHRDHDGLNNRRGNLRLATSVQNSANSLSQRGSSSRFKGVSVHKVTGKFEANIRINKKKKYLGLFSTEEDAARAYDEVALATWGEFSQLNFPVDSSAISASR